jgi:hypothetical protein
MPDLRIDVTVATPTDADLDHWREGALALYDLVNDGKSGPVEMSRELAQGLVDRFIVLLRLVRRERGAE